MLRKEMENVAKQAPVPPKSPPPPAPPAIEKELLKKGGIAALNDQLRSRAQNGIKSRTGTMQRTVRAVKALKKRTDIDDPKEDEQTTKPATLTKDSVQSLRMSIGAKLGLLPKAPQKKAGDEKSQES